MNSDSRIPRGADAQAAPATNPKADLRKRLLNARLAIGDDSRALWNGEICARALAWCAVREVTVLGVYWPLRGEPDLRPAYTELAARGVRLALPVVLEKDAPLAFADWIPGEAMVRDGMGVAVPSRLRIVARPPALLVPCLGFNGERLRLGYGGGFYDRTLAPAPRPATLGVAYACLALDFAGDAHDIALDNIVTEAGVL
ncbi:MAG TPA: 5-formyltetrahydrofolate cyclo-ligase [Janthinobacterium sp.]|nr:5-formyltetrahydrofolate cyclo-ligase [Janthinobacterium sp.]